MISTDLAKPFIDECVRQGITNKHQIAYIIATAYWETNRTLKPVKEAYWLSEAWRKRNLRYYPYYGRGFVQITWKANYKKYSDIIGVDFVSKPDKVLNPKHSMFILVHGFKHGTFTGKKISDYIGNGKSDFIGARRCINGLDKAWRISVIAKRMIEVVSKVV